MAVNRAVFGSLLIWLVLAVLPALAEPVFPELSGRVVDAANILSDAEEQSLSDRLAAEEQRSTNQLVVVTVPDLQGYDIADYGVRLGRQWGIGQADFDNGALLIVAPAEKKVRIEVGYGLEGTLTDIQSHNIIQKRILPLFRQGNMAAGIQSGVDTIIATLTGDPSADFSSESRQSDGSGAQAWLPMLFIGFIAITEMTKKTLGRGIANSAAFAGIAGLATTVFFNSPWVGLGVGVVIFLLMLITGAGNNSAGGDQATRRRHSRYGGGGFGGGFGGGGGGFGGGGGGFGGGGASGGW